MQVDLATMKALGVFQVDRHPCLSRKIGVSKEGLSLFGVLNRTKSKIGKTLLRNWFMQPLRDRSSLNKRLDSIQYFFDNPGSELVNEIRENLKHIKDTKLILKRIREVKTSTNDWINLYKSLYCFKNLYEICFAEESSRNVPGILERVSNLK